MNAKKQRKYTARLIKKYWNEKQKAPRERKQNLVNYEYFQLQIGRRLEKQKTRKKV